MKRGGRTLLKESFSKLGIEYFSVLDYRHVRETAEHIRLRSGVSPRSVIVYLLPYYSGECKNISRYAASLDYHLATAEIGGLIISALRRTFPEMKGAAFGDHSPIDERHAALIGGLGVIGDNGLIINEKYGSYVFIGDIITDIPAELIGAKEPVAPARCEGCRACKIACPTGVLRGDGEACLSAITQKKGELSEIEKALMIKHGTAWGCDICQEVCPHNISPKITPVEFFKRERIDCLSADSLNKMTDSELRCRAFGWRGRAVLERNLEVLSEEGGKKQ